MITVSVCTLGIVAVQGFRDETSSNETLDDIVRKTTKDSRARAGQ